MSFVTMEGGENMQYITDVNVLLVNLLFLAFLSETVVEILKNFVIRVKMNETFMYLLSVVVGIVLAIALQVSLFTQGNFFAYCVGIVICGLVASRGANYVHNFVGNLSKK